MIGGLRAGAACIVAALALALGACAEQDTGDRPKDGSSSLTIYSSLPLHGRDRVRSRDMVDAIKLALKEGNGKIGNLRVTYASLDSSTAEEGTWTRDKVLDNARQAVRDPNTIAYIGDLRSPATALALPLVNEGHILQVSTGSTYDGLTRPGARKGEPDRFYPSGTRTFGRVVAPDHVQASALVEYMQQAGVKRLALARDRGLYGSGIADQVQEAAESKGMKVVKMDRIDDAREGDLSGVARGVAALRADAFLFAGETDSGAARIFSAVAAADSDMLLFAPSGMAGRAFTRALSASAQRRMRITTPTLPAPLVPRAARAFVTRFEATFGREPAPDALLAYEATKLVLLSIHDAGERGNDREAVVEAFFQIGDRRSVLGTYSIDRNGDPSLSTFAGNRLRSGRLALDKVLKARG